MGAPSKRAKKIRAASEFDVVRLASELRAPRQNTGIYGWDLDAIRAARDAQMLGNFSSPARLAEAQRTDYAIFVAHLNRLAPQRGLPVQLVAPKQGARATRILDEAEALFGPKGVGIHPDTLSTINSHLADHGVAFGVNVLTPREDGSRIDFEHKSWPIEFVRWDPLQRCFVTRIAQGSGSDLDHYGCSVTEVPIVHGDGRWVVYQNMEHEPWKHGALLATALVWADHAFGVRDRAKSSTAHGNAKVVGTMPEGVAIKSEEGDAFFELLKIVASVDTPVGIKPFGSALDYITNNSQAWQIFKEIIDSNDKAAAKIYLGQDGTTNNSGGNYIKSDVLFGVRNDIVEGDLKASERGVLTGVIEPWAAINFGDSTMAPARVYQFPDADEDARRTSLAERQRSFFEVIQKAKEGGFDASQDYINRVASDFGVQAPLLPAETSKAPTITLAPTDIARVVRVNEARASAGLGPLTLPTGQVDPDGLLTVEEFSAKKAAQATAAIPMPTVGAPPQVPPSSNAAPGQTAQRPLRSVP